MPSASLVVAASSPFSTATSIGSSTSSNGVHCSAMSSPYPRGRARNQLFDEPVQERRLRPDDPVARRVDLEPRGAVELGELAQLAGARRPLHLERRAVDLADVDVGLDRPRFDDLAPAALAHRAERERLALGRQPADLLLELPARRLEARLALLLLALGDRPCAAVLARPVRPAHVAEHHLQPSTVRPSVEQQARAPDHPLTVSPAARRDVSSPARTPSGSPRRAAGAPPRRPGSS